MPGTGDERANISDKVPVLKELTIQWKQKKYSYKCSAFPSTMEKTKAALERQREEGWVIYFI